MAFAALMVSCFAACSNSTPLTANIAPKSSDAVFVATAPAATVAGTSSNFELIGHNALSDRGMNSALALYDHYAYIGSRTDGLPEHLRSGVQIVDIKDPAQPTVVGEIALTSVDPRLALGYTSRELRVWPQQNLLIVIYFGCSSILHACASAQDAGAQPFQEIAFFDISGANAAAPRLVSLYKPTVTPHEMFLWVDPKQPGQRALMLWTSPNETAKSLVVTDISDWRKGIFPELTSFNVVGKFPGDKSKFDVRLHSLSLSPDGKRIYLAQLGGGFLVADSSDLANNLPAPELRLITPTLNRAIWDNQGAHSSVKLPGTHYALSTEEIYGAALNAAFGFALSGCPWGWTRVIDIADETQPKIVAEYRIAENDSDNCANNPALQQNFSSYASHNPTALPNLVFATWHSGGLQAIDLLDPTHPAQAGYFLPTPELPPVTPDPALDLGSNGVIAWSYPVIRDGLIYYTDIHNGLYIVRYTGRGADAVARVGFLEGNSNLGDAAALDAAR